MVGGLTTGLQAAEAKSLKKAGQKELAVEKKRIRTGLLRVCVCSAV
jgi:hypothetical protein